MRVAGDQDLTLLLQFLFEVSLDLVGIFSEELFLALISILHLKEEVVSLIVSERTLKSYDVDLREILGDHIPESVTLFFLFRDDAVNKRNFNARFFQLRRAVGGAKIGIDDVKVRDAHAFAFAGKVQGVVDGDIGFAAAVMAGK